MCVAALTLLPFSDAFFAYNRSSFFSLFYAQLMSLTSCWYMFGNNAIWFMFCCFPSNFSRFFLIWIFKYGLKIVCRDTLLKTLRWKKESLIFGKIRVIKWSISKSKSIKHNHLIMVCGRWDQKAKQLQLQNLMQNHLEVYKTYKINN